MNRYKLIFEKTYTDRCISKKLQQEIIIESGLELNNEKELIALGNSKLYKEHPDFFQNANQLNPAGWTQPAIKNISQLNEFD